MLSLLVGREESYLTVFYMQSGFRVWHTHAREEEEETRRAKSAREGVWYFIEISPFFCE